MKMPPLILHCRGFHGYGKVPRRNLPEVKTAISLLLVIGVCVVSAQLLNFIPSPLKGDYFVQPGEMRKCPLMTKSRRDKDGFTKP